MLRRGNPNTTTPRGNQRRNGNRRNVRQRNVSRRNNGRPSQANGVSRRDFTVQRKVFTTYERVKLVNANNGLAFGIGFVNLRPNTNYNPYFSQLVETYGKTYEQYRLSRVRIYATPGKNMTNDVRIKSQVACRVDTDGQQMASSSEHLANILACTNTTIRMLPDARSVLLCDYNPICQALSPSESSPDGRQLPSRLQWLAIKDLNSQNLYQYHQWFGAQIALMIPDQSWNVNDVPHLSLKISVDIEFRGRVMNGVSLTVGDLTSPKPDEVTGTQADLRTNLLNGSYFPIDTQGINVANINGSVTDEELIGLKYRRQSDMILFEINNADTPAIGDRTFGANSYTT